MTWVNQIILAVEAGGKVAWSVLLSCAAALILEHFFPDLFVGLPEWIFPVIRLVAIFSLVLSIASILPKLLDGLISISKFIYSPINRFLIRNRLLEINISEVVILCKAIAEGSRTIWIKPDLPEAINLVDKGIIKNYWVGVVRGDGTDSFTIPIEVWRIMIAMEEFSDFSRDGLLLALSSGQFNEVKIILACLPQAHPAVRAQVQKHGMDSPL